MKRLCTAALAVSAMLAIPVAPALAGANARPHAVSPNAICRVHDARVAKIDRSKTAHPVAYFHALGVNYLAEARQLGRVRVAAASERRYRTMVADYRLAGKGYLAISRDDATGHTSAGSNRLNKVFKIENRLLKIATSLQLYNCYA